MESQFGGMVKNPPPHRVETYEHAIKLAESYLREIEGPDTPKLELIESSSMHKEYGWVFFYRTLNLDPQTSSSILPGNAPFLVLKLDGSVVVTGTTEPIERYLEEFEIGLGGAEVVPEGALRMRFWSLVRQLSQIPAINVVQELNLSARVTKSEFSLNIGYDARRGCDGGCLISYLGTEADSDLLETFYLASINPLLSKPVPRITWREDGRQVQDPFEHMRLEMEAVRDFVDLVDADDGRLIFRIQDCLETQHKNH